LVTDYDSRDAAYSNYQQAANAAGSVEANPYKRIIHEVKTSLDMMKKLIVRAVAQPSNTDIRMYDMGVFYLIFLNEAGSASPIVGDLFVEYEIEAFQPVGVSNATPSMVSFDHDEYKGSGANSFTLVLESGVGGYRPSPPVAPINNLVLTIPSGQPGQYLIHVVMTTISALLSTESLGVPIVAGGLSELKVYGQAGTTQGLLTSFGSVGLSSTNGAVIALATVTSNGLSGTVTFPLVTGTVPTNNYLDCITVFMGYPAGAGIPFGLSKAAKKRSQAVPITLKDEILDAFRSLKEDSYLRISQPPSPDEKEPARGAGLLGGVREDKKKEKKK